MLIYSILPRLPSERFILCYEEFLDSNFPYVPLEQNSSNLKQGGENKETGFKIPAESCV